MDTESTKERVPPPPNARLERAHEDLLLFTGSVLANRGKRSKLPRRPICSFCWRTGRSLKHLTEAGPLMICESCVVEGTRLFSKDSIPEPRIAPRQIAARQTCSACRRTQTQVKGFFSARGHRVCDGCLFVCLGILLEEKVLVLD